MKRTLIAFGALTVLVGCGTTETGTRHASYYRNGRIEGEWAREAGMHDRDYTIGHRNWVAIPEAVQPEIAQGATPTVAQEVTVTTGTGLEVADQADIDLRKEELVVGKREVSNGGVVVRTVIQTEEVSQPIELRREEYVVERIPASCTDKSKFTSSDTAFQGREIFIPLMKEEAISGKRTVLTEAVKIGKQIETDRQTISMPVRTEDIQVVKNPDLTDPKFSSVPRRSGAAGFIQAGTASTEPLTAPGMLKLAKEELLVGKQETDAGGVYLQKVIRTETASQPVDLRREEFTVERTPAAGQVASADFTPREIVLDLKREEAVAGTRNYVAETIRVRKQMEADQRMVSGTIRKEAVEVLRSGTPVGMGATGAGGKSAITTITESSAPCKTKDDLLSEHVSNCLANPGTVSLPAYQNIDVIAKDGVVTLKGTVGTEQEKKAIAKRVKNLSGVRSVKNELEVARP